MPFAAKIVVRRKPDGHYVAGFASNVGKGETIKTYGLWYGSQMSYLPFRSAMSKALAHAAGLNKHHL